MSNFDPNDTNTVAARKERERPLDEAEAAAGRKPEPKLSKYRLAPDRAILIRTNPPLVMTLFEAAAYIACSPKRLRNLVNSRRITSVRHGVKIVIRREWLDTYLENLSRAAQRPWR
jgi:excisionase family DNA binding protein